MKLLRISRGLSAQLGTQAILLLSVCNPIFGQQRLSATALIQQFETTTVFWRQIEVAEAIVGVHDASVLPRLESWLTNDDRHLRGNAAFIFAAYGDIRGLDVITAILNDRSDRPEGQGAVWAHRRPDAKRLHELQIVADRYHAVHLLGILKDPRAVARLIPLLKDREVGYKVPWALGQIGDSSAIQPLIKEVSDPNSDIRIQAIRALQELRAISALPALRQVADSNRNITPGQQVALAEAAREAIAKLEPLVPESTQK